MIIKGRSPAMRDVSRTHRVALDWLFDRINLEPKIQIQYVDTKNQLPDLLTKGCFTRDEWCNLLRLFNIMSFSVFSCSHVRSINKSKIMSKTPQEGKPSRKRSSGGEIKANDEFDIEERKSVFDAGFERILQPSEFRNAKSEFKSIRHPETNCEKCGRCE